VSATASQASTTPSFLLRRAALLQWVTVGHGAIEGTAALLASHRADSVALLGFGLDSMIEVLSASVVLWRIASLTGLRRWHLSERAGLRFVGVGFCVLSTSILYDASTSLFHREVPRESTFGILVAAASVLLMPFLGMAKDRIGGALHSNAMRADAKQTHFCAYLAGITLTGLILNMVLGWWWADSVAALVMAPIIGWEGIQSLRGKACGCCSHALGDHEHLAAMSSIPSSST